MKVKNYQFPKSSFLSIDKDLSLICNMIMKNERLQKLLYYTTADPLSQPALKGEEVDKLFGKNIKIVPKLSIDGTVLNYIIVSFDNFTPNATNPEFRDNVISFDIICHFDQWHIKDFELRPYRIAGELDFMLNQERLTGIGKLDFLGASQLIINDEFAGITLMYSAIHGEEDKKDMLNPVENEKFIQDFNEMYND